MLSVRDAYSEEDGFSRMISSDFDGPTSNPVPDYTANHPIPSNGFASGPTSIEMVCVNVIINFNTEFKKIAVAHRRGFFC